MSLNKKKNIKKKTNHLTYEDKTVFLSTGVLAE